MNQLKNLHHPSLDGHFSLIGEIIIRCNIGEKLEQYRAVKNKFKHGVFSLDLDCKGNCSCMLYYDENPKGEVPEDQRFISFKELQDFNLELKKHTLHTYKDLDTSLRKIDNNILITIGIFFVEFSQLVYSLVELFHRINLLEDIKNYNDTRLKFITNEIFKKPELDDKYSKINSEEVKEKIHKLRDYRNYLIHDLSEGEIFETLKSEAFNTRVNCNIEWCIRIHDEISKILRRYPGDDPSESCIRRNDMVLMQKKYSY